MTVQNFLEEHTVLLRRNGIQTARLDCLVSLEDVLGKNRAHILAHPEQPLTTEQLAILQKIVHRRISHEPLAYIRGHVEFYGLTFNVDERVLVPRPESEALIELLKRAAGAGTATIVDIGTGSGSLAITAKHCLPSANVIATDISSTCLEVAELNARQHNIALSYSLGSLLDAVSPDITASPTFFLCNLPYVPNDYPVGMEISYEPATAIFAGADGLDLYRTFFRQLASRQPLRGSHIVITESLTFQHVELAQIAKQQGYILQDSEGLAQKICQVA